MKLKKGITVEADEEARMKLSLKMNRKNPFRRSFLWVAIISCITLSIVFYYIGYVNNKAVRDQYNQNKVQLLMQDWEAQLQMITDISVRIASNHEFHPKFFMEDVTKEISLLKNLRQYIYFLPVTEEMFLYYGGNLVYRSTGTTLNLELFLNDKTVNDQECQILREELKGLNVSNNKSWSGLKAFTTSDDIYVLVVFKVNTADGTTNAVCGFRQDKDALGKRLQNAGGIVNGIMCLYQGNTLLYSNQEEVCSPEQKGGVTAISSDGLYTLYYLPNQETGVQNGMFLYLLLLVILDVIFVLIITNAFADRAYAPVMNMSRKYKEFISIEEESCNNALEELNHMIDSVLQSNLDANLKIREKQKLLRDQLLHMILEGRFTIDLDFYLNKIEIQLPGPWFFVCSLSFEDEEGVTEVFLAKMREELEKITEPSESIYVYTVGDFSQKRISVICSIRDMGEKDELCENISGVAESYCYEPLVGIGNEYKSISNLSTSWLESLDEIYLRKRIVKAKRNTAFIYDSQGYYGIINALEIGNEKAALEGLGNYIRQLKQEPLSLLMQHYVFSDFLGEVLKLGKKLKLELPRQNISMLITSKKLDDFDISAQKVIHDFCQRYAVGKNRIQEEKADTIYKYVKTHFMEYDMSLEKTAEELNVSTGAVRNAISEYTGKTYKEYLIQLRIEYAKQLLRTEDLPITEICNKIGYGSISYFIKLFRQNTGVTPAKYKSRLMDESKNSDPSEASGS